MQPLDSIGAYLERYGSALSERVLHEFRPLHLPTDPSWPALLRLKRQPFPAQRLAIMGIVKRWQEARCAAAVAECGTGKTLISLGSVFTHADGRAFNALAMVPPQLVEKWAREAFLTIPGVRVFVIDGVRNGVASNGFSGVNEVRMRGDRIVREEYRDPRFVASTRAFVCVVASPVRHTARYRSRTAPVSHASPPMGVKKPHRRAQSFSASRAAASGRQRKVM